MLLCTGGSLVAQQKGDVSVGANVAFQTSGSHIGVGAKARYGLTDRIRLDAGLTYFLPEVQRLFFRVRTKCSLPFSSKGLKGYPLSSSWSRILSYYSF